MIATASRSCADKFPYLPSSNVAMFPGFTRFSSALGGLCAIFGVFSALSAVSGQAAAQSQAPVQAASPVSAASAASAASGVSAEHGHDHLHGLHRQTHLTRLQERLTTPRETLRQQCRFVSDLSTPPPKHQVVLTFDDGPDPEQTPYVLEVLERYHIQATFFFIGQKVARHPELVAQVLEKKHLIGSHSWSHPNFHDIGEDAQRQEIRKGLEVMPAQPLKVFRYPYGNSSCLGNESVHQQGYRIVGWHVDTCDWGFDKDGVVDTHEALACGVLSQYRNDFVGHVLSSLRARQGGIVLMHEIHPNTLHQLEKIIQGVLAEGMSFTNLADPALEPSLR